MIALISFKEDLVITRKEAEKLKLQFTEHRRYGYRNNRLEKMSESCYYKDEVTEKDNEYFKDDKKIPSYYVYDRPINYLDWVSIKQNNQLVDLNWFALNCNYPFYVEKCIKSEEASVENIQTILYELEQKTKKIDNTIDKMTQQTFNQKLNVHVGGGLIVTYNDICLKEDCCTDGLQEELNNGWRIIACCIQPDQRRPDYILGRYNPSLDVCDASEAKR